MRPSWGSKWDLWLRLGVVSLGALSRVKQDRNAIRLSVASRWRAPLLGAPGRPLLSSAEGRRRLCPRRRDRLCARRWRLYTWRQRGLCAERRSGWRGHTGRQREWRGRGGRLSAPGVNRIWIARRQAQRTRRDDNERFGILLVGRMVSGQVPGARRRRAPRQTADGSRLTGLHKPEMAEVLFSARP